MPGEDEEDALEVASVHLSRSRHSVRMVRTKRSAIAFAFGARTVRGALTRLAAWDVRVGRRVVGPSR